MNNLYAVALALLALGGYAGAQHEHHTQPAPQQKQAAPAPKQPAQQQPHGAQPAQQQPQQHQHGAQPAEPKQQNQPQQHQHEQPAQQGTEESQHQHGSQAGSPQPGGGHGTHVMPGTPPPVLPKLGTAQAPAGGKLTTLEELEQLAQTHNPTLAQGQSEIRAAQARRRQAGLWPNPVVGYTGEELRGGRFRGGQHGAFIEQEIVLGGKLGLAGRVQQFEVQQAEAEAQEQQLRVRNGVRLAYYRALAAQELIAAQTELARIAADAVKTTRQLYNVGQADETDILMAEVEAEQIQLELANAQRAHRRAWAALAAVVGRPELPPATLAGNLESELPSLNAEAALARLLQESPAIRIAELGVQRAEASATRAARETIPNLLVRGGLQQNREFLEGTTRPVGMQGFAEVGVQLPLFNRNQGNVAAARAESERSRTEVDRVRLVLRERAAVFVQQAETARDRAQRYRERMLPRATRAYLLMREKYGQMAASYPQVLVAQRTLFELHTGYIEALEQAWASSVALEGFMLTDALEAPASPGDMERGVREINLPTERSGGPEE